MVITCQIPCNPLCWMPPELVKGHPSRALISGPPGGGSKGLTAQGSFCDRQTATAQGMKKTATNGYISTNHGIMLG